MTRAILLASTLTILFSQASSAVTLTPDSVSSCYGSQTCNVGGATLSAQPSPSAQFAEQTLLNLRGIGVAFAEVGDPLRQPEIQGDLFGGQSEGVRIEFGSPQTLSHIGIGHLANPDLFGADAMEVANITAMGSLGTATLTLQSVSNTGGLGSGFLVNDTSLFSNIVRQDVSSGEFLISDPFSSLGSISSLLFFASDTPTTGADNSDFSVTLVQTTPVPLPATSLLLLAAMTFLSLFLQRNRRLDTAFSVGFAAASPVGAHA